MPYTSRHIQVTAGKHTFNTITGCAPIGHYNAVIPPFITQDRIQQQLVLRGERTIQAIVGAHDRVGLRFFYNAFKSPEVNLAKCAFIDNAVAYEPVILIGVGGKMLDADSDALTLHSPHKCRAEYAGDQRVLRVVFEVPPAQWTALDIDAGREQHVYLFREAFFRNGFTHTESQVRGP
ncbi:hypothetical protein D3C71_1629340 [compost metagenome]